MRQDDERTIAQMPTNIPWSAVKLVYALPDAQGSYRDVIVDKVELKWPRRSDDTEVWGRRSEDAKPNRYIPGISMEIPWPEMDEPEDEIKDSDTYRMEVEEISSRTTLLSWPMPPTVIDELRNKYSKFRTRHNRDYEEMKIAQDQAEEKRKLMSRSVMTPMMELIEKNKAERAERLKDLTEEQLATIGEVMAQGRSRRASVTTDPSA